MYLPAFIRYTTKNFLLSLLLVVFLSSCSSPTSKFDFDSATWKADLNACDGKRLQLQPQVEEIRLQLLGLKEYNIRQLLGKPDVEELLVRSQKIYVYFLTPGPKCAANKKDGKTTALTVRLDALGNVREANLIEE